MTAILEAFRKLIFKYLTPCMSIVAVLIDLAHTYISHEAKRGETEGIVENTGICLLKS